MGKKPTVTLSSVLIKRFTGISKEEYYHVKEAKWLVNGLNKLLNLNYLLMARPYSSRCLN